MTPDEDFRHQLLIDSYDDFEMSPEQEKDYWSGKGYIDFYVIQNHPEVFEIEVGDYSGCAGGLEESVGIEYAIEHIWGLRDELSEGVHYTIKDLTVTFYRGDGWTTDDDARYEFSELESHLNPITWLKQKVTNIWWREVTCRFSD